MESRQKSPPVLASATPVARLDYAALGSSLIPPTPQNLPLVQDAADHYCGRRFLRKEAVTGMIMAAVLAAVGVWLLRTGRPGAIPMFVVAAACVVESVLAYVWPVPATMLVHAFTSLALTAWIGAGIFILTPVRNPIGILFRAFIVLLLLFVSLTSFAGYARYRRAASLRPTPDVQAWLEAIIRRLRRARPKHEYAFIEFTARVPSPWRFMSCKAELLPDMAACLLDTRDLRLLMKDDLRIERSGADRGDDAPVRVQLGRGARAVAATIKSEQFARYQHWRNKLT